MEKNVKQNFLQRFSNFNFRSKKRKKREMKKKEKKKEKPNLLSHSSS